MTLTDGRKSLSTVLWRAEGTKTKWVNIIIVIILITTLFIVMELFVFWFCLQEASEASHVATMKTIRQVKTVFIIFIAFVCCWIPYVIVLLYDSSDSLPLSVHLYTSMLAHLHASLNFAIYSLSNRTFRAGCRRLLTYYCHQTTPSNASVVVYSRSETQRTTGTSILRSGCFRAVNRTTVNDECYQLQQREGYRDWTEAAAETANANRPTVSICIIKE